MGDHPQKRLDHQQGETRKRRHTWKLNIWAGGLQEILASRVTAQTLSAANQLLHIRDRLTPEVRMRLGALLQPETDAEGDSDGNGQLGTAPALLLQLRGDPGRPSLARIPAELARGELVRRIGLPADLFDQVLSQELERYRRRVAVEAPHELRRHPEAARITWLAAFVHLRGRQLIDNLVDILTETIHQIGAR